MRTASLLVTLKRDSFVERSIILSTDYEKCSSYLNNVYELYFFFDPSIWSDYLIWKVKDDVKFID